MRALAKQCQSWVSIQGLMPEHSADCGSLMPEASMVKVSWFKPGACLVPRSCLLSLTVSAKNLFSNSSTTVFCLEDVPIIADRNVWNFSTSQIAHINRKVTHARNLPISREKNYAPDKDLQRFGLFWTHRQGYSQVLCVLDGDCVTICGDLNL